MDTTKLITLKRKNNTKPSSLLSIKNKHAQICHCLRHLLENNLLICGITNFRNLFPLKVKLETVQ